MKLFSKKGNAVATIVIVLLVVVSGFVVLRSQESFFESRLDYERVFSEIELLSNALVGHAEQEALQSGLSTQTNLWYCNQAAIPREQEVQQALIDSLENTQKILEREDVRIHIQVENQTIHTQDEAFIATLSKVRVNITSAQENRTYTIENGTRLALQDLSTTYDALKRWMQCDAGNIKQQLQTLLTERGCVYQTCCCDDASNKGFDDLVRQYTGVSEEQVRVILEQSVANLNAHFAGAASCDEQAPAGPCTIRFTQTTIQTQTDVARRVSNGDCQTQTCALTDTGIRGILTEWAQTDRFDMSACPVTREYPGSDLPADSGIIGTNPYPSSTGDTSVTYTYVGQPKAAADVVIACPEMGNVQVRIQFSVKNSCTPPAPIEQPAALCPGGETRCPTSAPVQCPTYTGQCVVDESECCPEPDSPYLCAILRECVAHEGRCRQRVGPGECVPAGDPLATDGMRCDPLAEEVPEGVNAACISRYVCNEAGSCEAQINPSATCGAQGCGLCGEDGMCTADAPSTTQCSPENAPPGTCMQYFCEEGACTREVPNHGACGSGNQCGGTCQMDGTCSFPAGNTCTGACNQQGTCSATGQCIVANDAGVCCGGSQFCESNGPTPVCCGESYCAASAEDCVGGS